MTSATPETDDEKTVGPGAQRITPTIGLDEAGKLLRCHPDTVRKMAKAGEIPGTKVGRAWVFYTERLLEWLDSRCKAGNISRNTSDLSGGASIGGETGCATGCAASTTASKTVEGAPHRAQRTMSESRQEDPTG